MQRAPCKSYFMGLLLAIVVLISTSCIAPESQSILGFASAPVTRERVKLFVDKDGIYAVSQRDLARVGLEIAQFDVGNLALSEGGQQVPFLVEDDLLIFYGQAPQSRYTPARAYILETGKEGTDMVQAQVGEIESPVVTSVPQTLHLEENHNYRADARAEAKDDVWFWHELTQQGIFETTADIPRLSQGTAQIKVSSWGLTDLPDIDEDHSFAVLINGEQIGNIQWDGQQHHESVAQIPLGLLSQGENTITLDNRETDGAFLDIMQINWLELTYQAPAVASEDRLYFSGAKGLVKTSGFSGVPLIFDISSATWPKLLKGWSAAGDDILLPLTTETRIGAIGPEGYYRPSLQPVHTSTWRDPNKQADLIIITTDMLATQLSPLVEARQKQGLNVALVDIQEIYDEFGFGDDSPESIRAFVSYAYNNWQEPRPRYLLLVGDGTTDYLGYANDLPANHIPSPLVPVRFGGETVSDSRLVDVDGDLKPDLAVGRWPVQTRAQVRSLVARTLDYEQSRSGHRTLFVSDGSEARFQAVAERIAGSSQMPREEIVHLNGANAEDLIHAWNEGSWLTTYVGHGSVKRWGKDNIFSTETVEHLDSSAPPIVVQLTCLTGLFAHPEQTSLIETMLLHPHGPVLSVAATSLTLSGHQEPFAIQLLQNLRDPNIVRVGDAFHEAKLALALDDRSGLQEISDTFLLFGDPSTPIIRP